MLTKRRLTGFLIIAAMALSAPSVYADNGGNFATGQSGQPAPSQEGQKQQGCHLGKGHGWKHGHCGKSNELNLTDVQKKQLKENWQKQEEPRKAASKEIKANRETLNQELVKPTLDMDKINQIQSQLNALQAKMANDRLNNLLEVKKILTPEQFAKFLEHKKEHKFRGGSHWRGREEGSKDHKHRADNGDEE